MWSVVRLFHFCLFLKKNDMRIKSSNPAFSGRILESSTHSFSEKRMTITGAIDRTGILLSLLIISGVLTYSALYSPSGYAHPLLYVAIIGGGITAFITAFIVIFKPGTAPLTAPLYAVLEGVFLGSLSCLPGYSDLTFSAMIVTCCILGVMLFLYRSKIITPTHKFKAGVMTATIGLFVIIGVNILLSLFGVGTALYSGGLFAIVFSLFVIALASCFLILDFELIEKMSDSGAPKKMEWYAGFSLMLTLVWIYLEVLRLLSYLRD